jgi:hypothetical protein
MAIETGDSGNSTGTLDPVEVEYLNWEPEGSGISIHMHLGAVDGIARDVIERLGRQARPIVEVGGLLLGRLQPGDRAEVWIERYQRIPCAHTFGPKFVLDSDDMDGLEKAAAGILATGELSVVGFYRSHVRPGFQLEESDFELIRRYFSDPADLILLIKAETPANISGEFYTWDAATGPHPVGGELPFHGRVVTPDTLPDTTVTADDSEATGLSRRPPAIAPVPREIPRRFVPDFTPPRSEPAPSVYGLMGNSEPWPGPPVPEETTGGGKKWLPLFAALLLVGGIVWFMLQPGRRAISNPAPAQIAETGRPLGLYVDSTGVAWRVSWNTNATALHDARNVQLFVREGDDQTHVELSAKDLASGSYKYTPTGNDVTFRLEVVDHSGQVSAESFRLLRQAPAAAAKAAAPAVSTPPPPGSTDSRPPAVESNQQGRFIPPKATYRAPPVVAAGIRPRIKSLIAIDVRVHIDARGRVTSATPLTKQHSGLEDYLASRAVQAARLWRFEPAHEKGVAVPGTQTLHFVFDK